MGRRYVTNEYIVEHSDRWADYNTAILNENNNAEKMS